MQRQKWALPVTAIALVDLPSLASSRGPLVLGAEGSSIRIFRLKPLSILLKQQIFTNQVIHGIQCSNLEERHDESPSNTVACVFWGGREIATALLNITIKGDEVSASYTPLQLRATIDDYVLDACYFQAFLHVLEPSVSSLRILAVTAHNTLFCVSFSILPHGEEKSPVVQKVSEGAPCSLYSAHIKVLDSSHVLIAAGTVFGAVHVWHQSIVIEAFAKGHHPPKTWESYFSGHEGSVFGVRIFQLPHFPSTEFLISSCSDDRSIKIWLVREDEMTPQSLPSCDTESTWEDPTGFVKHPERSGYSKQPLMTRVMAHLSRIWSTRISGNGTGHSLLFSFGEDGTSQAWQIPAECLASEIEATPLTLQPDHSTGYHIGKNIWAGEIHHGAEDIVVTGGADGRITLASLQSQDENNLWSSRSDTPLRSNSAGLTSDMQLILARDGGKEAVKYGYADFNQSQFAKVDTFKSYAWLSEVRLLATTTNGQVKLGALRPKAYATDHKSSIPCPVNGSLVLDWACLGQLDELASFSLVSSTPGQFALLTGGKGDVYIYLEANNSLKEFLKLPRKVNFLTCSMLSESTSTTDSFTGHRFGAVITCIGMRNAYFVMFDVQTASNALQAQDHLRFAELPEAFLVTSASFLSKNLLVLGSRTGDLAFYDVGDAEHAISLFPLSTHPQLHGKESITSITEISASQSKLIVTTGRDSHVAIHKIASRENRSFELQTIHRVLLPFGPNIEGSFLPNDTDELLLWGFSGHRLIVWSHTEHRETMNVDCGGINRNWSYLPCASGTGGGSLAWTRASECHVYFQAEASHTLLQSGTHGREIRAIAIRPNLGDNLGCVVATGAEDTTIRISRYREASSDMLRQPFDCLGVLLNHTTGIQNLAWSSNGKYLFSAAGKEEFYVWQCQYVSRVRFGVVNVACCPKVSESGDLRITDFDILDDKKSDTEDSYLIAMGYSDSTIRLWRFSRSLSESGPRLILSSQYSTVCITQCQFIHLESKPHILTCATDGHLALWRLNGPNESSVSERRHIQASTAHHHINQNISENPVAEAIQLELCLWASSRIHQSGIKSMALQKLSDRSILVATGGDDNAIGITIVTVPYDSWIGEIGPRLMTLLIPKAHAAAINALSWLREFQEERRQELTPNPSTEEETSTVDTFILLSASNDQRLKKWTIIMDCSPSGVDVAQEYGGQTLPETDLIHISKTWSGWSSVADVAAMDVVEGSSDATARRIVLAGVGVETWIIDKDESGDIKLA